MASPRAAPLTVVIALVASVCGPTAHAQPTVRVRAESRIELRAERRPEQIAVLGALRDDLGEPLADRPVEVRAIAADVALAPARAVARTRADGRFTVELALPTGAWRLVALFEGDEEHERVEVERALDLDRADVALRVTVPGGGRLDLDVASHAVQVEAQSEEGGGALTVELVDELDRPLGAETTDASGHARFAVASRALGGPGAGRLVVRSQPDARRAGAQTEVPVVRFRATSLELTASVREGKRADPVHLAGRLSDRGGPLDRKAVGIYAGGKHLATVLTDGDGRFALDTTIDGSPASRWSVIARFASDAPWRGSSASNAIEIEVASGGAGPWIWLLASIVLSVALLFFITRRAPRPAAASRAAPPAPVAGVATGRRRGLRADRSDLGGVVLDLRDDDPIAHARVVLTGAAGVQMVPVDPLGAFHVGELAPGTWGLRVEADGFSAEATAVNVPHRGEWSALCVRLVSLRARALDAFEIVARAAVAPGRFRGVLTPRELVRRAGAERAHAAGMDVVAREVERAGWGPEVPTEVQVEEIERGARAAADRLAEADPIARVDEPEQGSL